jgi:hypothetical protein
VFRTGIVMDMTGLKKACEWDMNAKKAEGTQIWFANKGIYGDCTSFPRGIWNHPRYSLVS